MNEPTSSVAKNLLKFGLPAIFMLVPFFLIREFNPGMLWGVQTTLAFILVLIIFLIPSALMFRKEYDKYEENFPWKSAIIGLVGISLWIPLMVTTGWRGAATIAGDVIESTEARPDYLERMPYTQAQFAVTRSLEGTVGDISNPRYVDGRWCGYLSAKQTFKRNEIVKVSCVTPDGAAETAEFATPAPANNDGIFRTSTLIAATRATGGAVPAYDSVYAYIDENGEPFLVIPMLELNVDAGYTTKRPAGVVIYDTNGNTTYKASVDAGEVPGPVMPIEVAKDIRDSLNARFGFRSYLQPRRAPEAVEPVEPYGPNALNGTEYTLEREDGRIMYVTPLTPLGSSDNIVAYLEIEADTLSRGDIPTATIYRLENTEAGPRAVFERVITLYDADIDFGVSSVLTEVTPSENGMFRATIIAGQLANYTLTVEAPLTANNSVGTVCIFDAETGEEIRCDGPTARPAAVGSLRGIGGNASSVLSGGDTSALSEFTTDELLTELQRRSANGEFN